MYLFAEELCGPPSPVTGRVIDTPAFLKIKTDGAHKKINYPQLVWI